MSIILTEPWLDNQASMTSQIHFEQPDIPVSDLAKELLKEAKKNPTDPEAWIKLGRAYRRQQLHRDAIDAYAMGITYNPFYPLLYRHKAHAYINISRYAEAASEFELALRIDPTNWDCWYHGALAFFLLGQYERAEKHYKVCYDMCREVPELICCTDWLYMILMRLNKKEEAAKLIEKITPDMDPKHNHSYFRRILMYKGLFRPEELLPEDLDSVEDVQLITMGFGLANYYCTIGQDEKASNIMRQVIKAGEARAWSAFGYQAALVDIKNRGLKL